MALSHIAPRSTVVVLLFWATHDIAPQRRSLAWRSESRRRIWQKIGNPSSGQRWVNVLERLRHSTIFCPYIIISTGHDLAPNRGILTATLYKCYLRINIATVLPGVRVLRLHSVVQD